MSREKWRLIKHSKGYYVSIYRRLITLLSLSTFITLVLLILIARAYLRLPERDYYATSGVTPPIQLTARLEPNFSSAPLLGEEVETGAGEKVIPE